jgi:hypothetical protein
LLQGAGFGTPTVNLSTPGILRLTVSTGASTALLPLDTTGSLVLLELRVNPGAAVGPSVINLRADFRDALTQTVTSLADRATQDLVLSPAPTNADTDAVDGVITIGAWHNAANPLDLTTDGAVTVNFTQTVTGVLHPRHDTRLPEDASAGKQVTPFDVLLVISRIDAYGSGPLPVSSPIGLPLSYLDVSGDERLTPPDARLVITATVAGDAADTGGVRRWTEARHRARGAVLADARGIGGDDLLDLLAEDAAEASAVWGRARPFRWTGDSKLAQH